MSFLNLPWRWGRRNWPDRPTLAYFHAVKWDRGPVSFYRYRVTPMADAPSMAFTQWVVCIANNLSVAFHFPDRFSAWLDRWFGCVGKGDAS